MWLTERSETATGIKGQCQSVTEMGFVIFYLAIEKKKSILEIKWIEEI